MPVPSSISDLSTTPSLNSPAGTESPSTVDDYLRTQAAFIKQVDDKATGTVKSADLAAPGGSALVGFKQTATGSAARTAFDKMSESVSVRDFGAVGDWNGITGTDDTAAFVACREHCRNNSVKMLIPKGRYRLTSSIYFGTTGTGFPYGGFSVEGDGQNSTEIVLDFNASIGLDLNPGSGSWQAYARSQFGGFRVTVPAGRTVDTPVRIINAYDNTFHDIHVYVPTAGVTSAFRGIRVSGAIYFNTFRNLWVEVYGGDATVGKGFDIGNGRFECGNDFANTSANTFISCRTRGFNTGINTSFANHNTFIGCDAEVCTYGFKDLGSTGNKYDNCWSEGCSTAELLIDRETACLTASGTTFTTSAFYTIVTGGFWEKVKLDYAIRPRIKAKYNSIEISTTCESVSVDSQAASGGTITGAANDAQIFMRRTSPFAYNAYSMGNKRFAFEAPNTSGTARLMFGGNGADFKQWAYRDNGGGGYGGTSFTYGSGTFSIANWNTGAIGSETETQVFSTSTSSVRFGPLIRPITDAGANCGEASGRWSVVYAASGTINTSDAREKQQIREVSEAERAVAVRLKSMIRAYKFNDAVAEKGEAARIHFGVIAQDVKAAFEAEGLVAEDYAVLCFDEWHEQAEVLDDDGNVTAEYRPAGNRYGVRYEELLAFIISAL